jgi:hypothetical protein
MDNLLAGIWSLFYLEKKRAEYAVYYPALLMS